MSQNNFNSREARQRSIDRKRRQTNDYFGETYKKQIQKDFRNGILAVILVVILIIIILVTFPGLDL